MNEDFMARFGFTEEELREAEEKNKLQVSQRNGSMKDGRVCACGHSARSHTSESNSPTQRQNQKAGVFYCRPSKTPCPCKEFKPVLLTENSKLFLYKSTGRGPNHALSRGIAAALDRKVPIRWMDGIRCERSDCGSVDGLRAVPFDDSNRVVDHDARVNRILCGNCEDVVRGIAQPVASV